jgi:hypothetical protein
MPYSLMLARANDRYLANWSKELDLEAGGGHSQRVA